MKLLAVAVLVLPLIASNLGAQCNPVLDSVARADQAARQGSGPSGGDAERVHIVLEQVARNGIRTPDDQINAAIVLVHSPLSVRDGKLTATNPDHFLLAHLLAMAAYEAKRPNARFLVAQSLDRYLTFTTGVQRYGTNRTVDMVTGKVGLVPVDRNTTDLERAKYGVAPLHELLKRFEEWPRP
jgi:hypothetical protein